MQEACIQSHVFELGFFSHDNYLSDAIGLGWHCMHQVGTAGSSCPRFNLATMVTNNILIVEGHQTAEESFS